MEYYHKPTGQVVDKFQVQSLTGFNTEMACPENLREVGVYSLIDQTSEGILDNPDHVFIEEDGVFYKRNSILPLEISTAKTRAIAYIAEYADQEISRLISNSGFNPTTITLLYLLGKTKQEIKATGLDTDGLEQTVQKVLTALHSIEISESTEDIKQLLKETVPS